MTIEIHPTQAYCGFVGTDGPCYGTVDSPRAKYVVRGDHSKRLCERHAEKARKVGLELEPIEVLWR